MKKIVLILTAVMLMAMSSICLASDGSDLSRQQGTAQLVIDSFGEKAPAFGKVSANFEDSLKKNMDEKKFADVQKQVKEKFGDLKQVKFYSFERFDAQDRLTYLASFSNANVVSIVYVFDKDNKLVEFGLFPQQAAQQDAAAAEGAK